MFRSARLLFVGRRTALIDRAHGRGDCPLHVEIVSLLSFTTLFGFYSIIFSLYTVERRCNSEAFFSLAIVSSKVKMDALTPQQTTELVSRIECKKAHMRLDKLWFNSYVAGPLLGFG